MLLFVERVSVSTVAFFGSVRSTQMTMVWSESLLRKSDYKIILLVSVFFWWRVSYYGHEFLSTIQSNHCIVVVFCCIVQPVTNDSLALFFSNLSVSFLCVIFFSWRETFRRRSLFPGTVSSLVEQSSSQTCHRHHAPLVWTLTCNIGAWCIGGCIHTHIPTKKQEMSPLRYGSVSVATIILVQFLHLSN